MPHVQKHPPGIYQIGKFEFDPTQRELRSSSGTTPLPVALNKLLTLFVTQPGSLVTREDIADALWDNHTTVDVTNGINSVISRLRTQFTQDAGDDIYIETVVGAGYRLKAPVTILNPEPEPTPETTPVALPALPSTSTLSIWRRWQVIAPAVCLCAAAVSGAFYLAHGNKISAAVPTTAGTEASLPVRMLTREEPEDGLSVEAISPSGDYVAYSDHNGIALRILKTHEDHSVSPPFASRVSRISWAPDERHLLITGTPESSALPSAKSQSWLLDLDGNPRQLLLDNAELATLSPDGHHIAFFRNGQSEVWAAGQDGKEAHKIFAADAGEIFLAVLWSPDSHRLIVDRSSPAATSTQDTAADRDSPTSHDDPLGHRSHHRWNYESHDATSGALLASYPDLNFESGALLNDGRFLYLIGISDQEKKLAQVKTDPRTNAILSQPEILTTQQTSWADYLRSAASFSSSQDGTRFSAILERPLMSVFTSDLRFQGNKLSMENVRRLITHVDAVYPTGWSPDGKRVIFDNDSGPSIGDGKTVGIVKFDPPSDTRYDGFAQYTPDGNWILFMRITKGPAHKNTIERLPADGGPSIELSVPGDIEEFQCSRSSYGTCIVRETEGKQALVYYALDPVLGRGAELARTPWKPYGLGDWKLSPDGKTVATADHDPLHPAVELISLTKSTNGDPAGTTTRLPISGFGSIGEAIWSADGKYFFVQSNTPAGTDLLYVERSGRATVLRKAQHAIWAVPSRDGKKIAFPDMSPPIKNVWVGDSMFKTLP